MRLNPDNLAELFAHAIRCHQAGDLPEAERSYKAILTVSPDQFDTLHYLGLLEAQRGQFEPARCLLTRALEINAESFEAHTNLGNVLLELKRYDEALASYDRALALKPDYAQALGNRGNVLLELKRYEEALASYDRALALNPDYVEAHYNRGNALLDLKRLEEALASYDRALGLRPEYAGALSNRGDVLCELKRHEEALASYDRALALDGDNADTLNSRGNALQELRRYEEAVVSYERALALKPDYAYALGMLAHSKMHCAEWNNYKEQCARLAAEVRAGRSSAVPFVFLSLSESARDQLLCSRICVRDKYAFVSPVWRGERYVHGRIRVAYLSADFHEHATAYLMAGLFERHDKERFETIAVSFGADGPNEMRTRLQAAFDRFINVRQRSDREIAHLLRELEVDIAIDLKGFTTDGRPGICALRCAPVQVNYLGYPGTMGADYFDYILADRFVIPAEDQACYSEKVVYLPDTYQGNDSTRRIAERTPARAEAGLPAAGFVYCCFNNNYKITPEMFDRWMHLLNAVDGSVLWLLEDNPAAARNLRREAQKRGIAPESLVFAPRVKLEDHLARHRLADLFLDTLPYNAHTTASDALWAGLPVVTCLGTTFAGRVAASLLNAIGLPELITHSLEEYEALALKLAKDGELLAGIKAKLARNRNTTPLFDTDRFRRHLEAAYVMMWERCQRGETPASFAVEPIQQLT